MLKVKTIDISSLQDEKLKLGIIIPFYEGFLYFDKLFHSLIDAIIQIEQKNETCLLIIDNSITDNSIFFKPFEKNIIYLRTKKRLGFGRACNIGYKYFKEKGFDFVQIINQDGYVDKFCLSRLINTMLKCNNVIMASSLPLTYNKEQLEPFFIKYYLHYIPKLITDLIHQSPLEPCGYITKKVPGTCFMFCLRGEYSESQLFDQKFFMYFEDEDLCERLKQLKLKIVLVPNSLFFHQHSHTTDTNNKLVIDKQKNISERYMRIKHSKYKLKTLYGMFIDDFFDGSKQLLRGRFLAFIKILLIDFKVIVLITRK